MPQDNGARDANLGKRVVDQACLGGRRPEMSLLWSNTITR